MLSTLQRTFQPDEIVRIFEIQDDSDKESMQIRCPLCAWHPHGSDRWSCVDVAEPEHFLDGCGTSWHTFATHGRCPGCSHQWRWTSCLACGGWSLHDDWYVQEPTGPPAG
jgi:hypothetical protein